MSDQWQWQRLIDHLGTNRPPPNGDLQSFVRQQQQRIAELEAGCEECCGLTEPQLQELLDESRGLRKRIAELEAELKDARIQHRKDCVLVHDAERVAVAEARREGARRGIEYGRKCITRIVTASEADIDAALGVEVDGD